MNATILSIGDELILGQTLDTNSQWLSTQLATVGIAVLAHVTVADEQHAIERAIREGAAVSDVLLVSGGLGPTEDDLTRQALAAVMGVELELDQKWFEEMTRRFTAYGHPMPASNRMQAMLPAGSRPIVNMAGTAVGINAQVQSAKGSCHVYVMPGVPREMKAMFGATIRPELEQFGAGAILSRTLHTFGLGESSVAELLGHLMDRDRNPSVGTTVSGGVVSLRINSRFDHRDEAQSRLEETVESCRHVLGDLCYGQEGQTLGQVVSEMLWQRGEMVATAESCTGGLLAKLLTDLPGASDIFQYGWVTYANQAKQQLLGVPEELLKAHGAVSTQVVAAMAQGARERAGSDYALAISGIAGPGGGSEEKPVGTVCIALASADGVHAKECHFSGDRETVRLRSALRALNMLRYKLMGVDDPAEMMRHKATVQ